VRHEPFSVRLARVGFIFALFACALVAVPTSGMGPGHRDFGPGSWKLLLLVPAFYIFWYLITYGTWKRK